MGNITPESIVNDLRYLQLLSRSFPTIADAILDIMSGKEKGTLFLAHTNLDFDLMHYLNNEY